MTPDNAIDKLQREDGWLAYEYVVRWRIASKCVKALTVFIPRADALVTSDLDT